MYGAFAYGSVPYGATGGVTLFDVDAMLNSSREELVYTVELKVWEIGGAGPEVTLRLASAMWATAPTDYPASTPFDGVLESYNFKTSINNGDRFGGMASGEGTIVFNNADGAYDDYVDAYAADGREVIVRLGRKSDQFADHIVIRKGVAVDWEASQDSVTLTIKDKGDKLDVPAQPNVYAGTGGAEGGEDLNGKRKPIINNRSIGFQPVLVEPSLLIYQANDRGENGLLTSSVFDRGVLLTNTLMAGNYADYTALAAASVAAGEVSRSNDGFIKLGSTPSGLIFGSFHSSHLSSVQFGNDAPTTFVVLDFLESAAGIVGDELNQASFDATTVAQPNQVFFSVGPEDSSTAADVISRLMTGIGGFAGFNRLGKVEVGILAAPAGNPVAYFDREDGGIIDLRRETMPSGIWPPPWRWRVAWLPSETVFTDFAGSVSDTIRSIYATPYRLATSEDLTILDDHPQARDPSPVEAQFQEESAAQAEADRLRALYSSGYRLFRFTTGRQGLNPKIKLGAETNVTDPRWGFAAGRNLVTVSIEDKIELRDGGEVEQVEIGGFG